MSVTIRLMRFGKRDFPSYRIVALDKRKKRNGAYLENIGTYNPLKEKDELTINREKLDKWLQRGAQLSEGMAKLAKKAGIK